MRRKDILMKLGIVMSVMSVIGSMAAILSYKKEEPVAVSHPVRVYERDIQEEVFGVEPETEFIPAVYTGGLVISPEDDYYNTLEFLGRCVEAEAGNQGMLGKRLVIDVILNRVNDDSGEWPDTIAEVISQPFQFSTFWDGSMDRVEEVTEETWEAIFKELEDITCPDIYYFTSEGFHVYGTPWEKIGDHYFNKK